MPSVSFPVSLWMGSDGWVQGTLCQACGPCPPQCGVMAMGWHPHTNTLPFRPASVPLHTMQRQSSPMSALTTRWSPWTHPPLFLWYILPLDWPRTLLSSGQVGPGHSHYSCQGSSTRQGLEDVEASEEQRVFSRLDSSPLLWREAT